MKIIIIIKITRRRIKIITIIRRKIKIIIINTIKKQKTIK